MSYNTYLVDSSGLPRNHHAIFVETHEKGESTGYLYQVTGNIQSGMVNGHKFTTQPEIGSGFGGTKKFLGVVKIGRYPDIRTTCDSIDPPIKQFDGPKKLYPLEPLGRCQEWTRKAIETLIAKGIIE